MGKCLAKRKAYEIIDRHYFFNALQLYRLGGRLVSGVKSFYVNSRTCVSVK